MNGNITQLLCPSVTHDSGGTSERRPGLAINLDQKLSISLIRYGINKYVISDKTYITDDEY
jgi:hypothetical protein